MCYSNWDYLQYASRKTTKLELLSQMRWKTSTEDVREHITQLKEVAYCPTKNIIGMWGGLKVHFLHISCNNNIEIKFSIFYSPFRNPDGTACKLFFHFSNTEPWRSRSITKVSYLECFSYCISVDTFWFCCYNRSHMWFSFTLFSKYNFYLTYYMQ